MLLAGLQSSGYWLARPILLARASVSIPLPSICSTSFHCPCIHALRAEEDHLLVLAVMLAFAGRPATPDRIASAPLRPTLSNAHHASSRMNNMLHLRRARMGGWAPNGLPGPLAYGLSGWSSLVRRNIPRHGGCAHPLAYTTSLAAAVTALFCS
jgi:hypothetical protein